MAKNGSIPSKNKKKKKQCLWQTDRQMNRQIEWTTKNNKTPRLDAEINTLLTEYECENAQTLLRPNNETVVVLLKWHYVNMAWLRLTVKWNKLQFFEPNCQRSGLVVASDKQTEARVVIGVREVQSSTSYDPQICQRHIFSVVRHVQYVTGNFLNIL